MKSISFTSHEKYYESNLFFHFFLFSFFKNLKFYVHYYHCVKSVRIQSLSGPYFHAFGLITERYWVSQSEYGKIRTRKTLNMGNFHAVYIYQENLKLLGNLKFEIRNSFTPQIITRKFISHFFSQKCFLMIPHAHILNLSGDINSGITYGDVFPLKRNWGV